MSETPRILDPNGPLISEWDLKTLEAKWLQCFDGNVFADMDARIARIIGMGQVEIPRLIQAFRRMFSQHRDLVHGLAALLYQNGGMMSCDPVPFLMARQLMTNISIYPDAEGRTIFRVNPYPVEPKDLYDAQHKPQREVLPNMLTWTGPLPEMLGGDSATAGQQK